MPGRGHDGAPVHDLDVHALLLEGRDIDTGEALAGGNRERAQLAGLDLALELAVARNAGRDLAAEHRRERLAAARKGDVVDLRGVGAGGLDEQRRQDVVGAAGRAARPSHLRRIGLRGGGEVLNRLVRRVGRHDDDERVAGKARDRRDLSRLTGDLLVRIAPTMVMPLTISWLGSPFAPLTNCARPMVPPAPVTFVT